MRVAWYEKKGPAKDTLQLGEMPTPNAGPQNDGDTTWQDRRKALQKKRGNNGFGLTLGQATSMTSWPTPNATDSTGAGTEGRAGGANLQTAAAWTSSGLSSRVFRR